MKRNGFSRLVGVWNSVGSPRGCHGEWFIRQRLALRGGDFNCPGAGLFALILYERRSLRSQCVGFRPALAPKREAARSRLCGRRGQKGTASSPMQGETPTVLRAASSSGKRGAGG